MQYDTLREAKKAANILYEDLSFVTEFFKELHRTQGMLTQMHRELFQWSKKLVDITSKSDIPEVKNSLIRLKGFKDIVDNSYNHLIKE